MRDLRSPVVPTRALLAVALLWAAAPAALAEEPTITHQWSAAEAERLPYAEVVAEGDRTVLVVTADEGGGTYPLVHLDAGGITATRYAVRGQVRTAGVEGAGYLEMWSVLDDGGRYFTRTLATVGPMAALTGSSPWRAFELPFDLADSGRRPRTLEISLVLPGAGEVRLGPLELIER